MPLWKMAYFVRGRDRVCRAISKMNRDGWSRVHFYREFPPAQARGRALNNQARVQGFTTRSGYIASGTDRIYRFDSDISGGRAPGRFGTDQWVFAPNAQIFGDPDPLRLYPFANPPYISANSETGSRLIEKYEFRSGDVLVIHFGNTLRKGSGFYSIGRGAWKIINKDGGKIFFSYANGEGSGWSKSTPPYSPDPGEVSDYVTISHATIIGHGPLIDTNLAQPMYLTGAANYATSYALIFTGEKSPYLSRICYESVWRGYEPNRLPSGFGSGPIGHQSQWQTHMGCPLEGLVPNYSVRDWWIPNSNRYNIMHEVWENSEDSLLLPTRNWMNEDIQYEYISTYAYASGWNWLASKNLLYSKYVDGISTPPGWVLRGGEEVEVLAGTDVEGNPLTTGIKAVIISRTSSDYVPGVSTGIRVNLNRSIHPKDVNNSSLGLLMVQRMKGDKASIRVAYFSDRAYHYLIDRGRNVITFGLGAPSLPEGTIHFKGGTGVSVGVSDDPLTLVAPKPGQKGSGGTGPIEFRAVADMQKFQFGREPISIRYGDLSYGCSQEFLVRAVKESDTHFRVECRAPLFKNYQWSPLDIAYLHTYSYGEDTAADYGSITSDSIRMSGFITEKISNYAVRVKGTWLAPYNTSREWVYCIRINKRGTLHSTKSSLTAGTYGYVKDVSWNGRTVWIGPTSEMALFVPRMSGTYSGDLHDTLIHAGNAASTEPPIEVDGEYKVFTTPVTPSDGGYFYAGFVIKKGPLWDGDTRLRDRAISDIAIIGRAEVLSGDFAPGRLPISSSRISTLRFAGWKPILLIAEGQRNGKNMTDPEMLEKLKGFPPVSGGEARIRLTWPSSRGYYTAAGVVAPVVDVTVSDGKVHFSYPGWYFEHGWMLCINDRIYTILEDMSTAPVLPDGSYSARLFWRPTRRGIRAFTRMIYINPYEWRDRIRSFRCTFNFSGQLKFDAWPNTLLTVNGSSISGTYDCEMPLVGNAGFGPETPAHREIALNSNYRIRFRFVMSTSLRPGFGYTIEYTDWQGTKTIAGMGSYSFDATCFPEDVRDLAHTESYHLRSDSLKFISHQTPSSPINDGVATYNPTSNLTGTVQINKTGIIKKRYF